MEYFILITDEVQNRSNIIRTFVSHFCLSYLSNNTTLIIVFSIQDEGNLNNYFLKRWRRREKKNKKIILNNILIVNDQLWIFRKVRKNRSSHVQGKIYVGNNCE